MFEVGNIKIKNKVIFAPMAGVSNISFRTIIKEMGAGLIYSEMISTMGIKYGSQKTIDLINFNETKYIEDNYHPDIIDINMGCPVPKIALKSQAGSALLKNPDKIYEIVKKVVENTNTPISVKIRSGWDENSINAVEVAQKIEQAGASLIAIHARTRSQGYSGKANWNIIKQVKENVSIPVIGNGDIKTIYDAKKMLDETKCDAIMIGRATLGNPWFIKECVEYIENNKIIAPPTNIEKIDMINHHYELLKKYTSEKQALLEIRMHALWYIKGLPNIKEYKNKITSCKTEQEFKNLLNEIRENVK